MNVEIGFSTALHLQCVETVQCTFENGTASMVANDAAALQREHLRMVQVKLQ
jgi:hypothetical protein